MSKYDNIKTAKELVHEVMISGFSTKAEDICKAQDIFGHSTVEELAELANDIGRDDSNGNPDPNGSWSSGRRETRSTFYMIASNIWSFDDLVRFWNRHTNPEHRELEEVRGKLKQEMAEHSNTKRDLEVAVSGKAASVQRESKLHAEYELLESNLEDAKQVIIELKAKLYDMMQKEVK